MGLVRVGIAKGLLSSPSESILSTPSLASALIIGEMSFFSNKERRLPSSRYWALVIAWNWMKFALLFLAEGSDLHALWVVRLHLWMVGHPFKERMRIHQQLDIRKRPDIEFTPFSVNSLKFPCLPQYVISQDGYPFPREES
jgi:hypothetical protein